ncbi:MAG TPA: DUF222 domain-containing protein [Trebonia sp.]
MAPSGRLALIADELSGPEQRCQGATDNELIGLVRAWASIESWAAGAKLGVIAEMIRRDEAARNAGHHGDLPDEWSPSLRHELAAALDCSAQSAETTAWLAWERRARLPGIGALLDDGTLTLAKVRAVMETFKYLNDGDAASAEALIRDRLAGKTYPQVLRLAEQAALTIDPELAERRREQAQKESRGYRPGNRLRHLVQVRDGACTFPPCNRHAVESDFEHAVPYDKGGRTCACNAGARSRACHRVKQSKGWNVTQPQPGWHRWQTPAGRVYLQEPWRYPA